MPYRRRLLTLLLALIGGAAALALPAGAEVLQQGGLVVSFGGKIAPRKLPRAGTTPIGVEISGRIRSADGGLPPSLRQITLAINRNGVLDRRGLPTCSIERIQPSSTGGALRACGRARVGSGSVGGQIVIPGQPPVPFSGHVVAFNGRLRDGRPAILAHMYTTRPAPLTFILAFSIERTPGTFGLRLNAVVPRQTRRVAHITRFNLRLRRTYEVRGQRRSYLSGGCPAPAGFPGATFPLVHASYAFDGGNTLSNTLVRTCHAR